MATYWRIAVLVLVQLVTSAKADILGKCQDLAGNLQLGSSSLLQWNLCTIKWSLYKQGTSL